MPMMEKQNIYANIYAEYIMMKMEKKMVQSLVNKLTSWKDVGLILPILGLNLLESLPDAVVGVVFEETVSLEVIWESLFFGYVGENEVSAVDVLGDMLSGGDVEDVLGSELGHRSCGEGSESLWKS
jgi:hypothetical protein